MTKIFETTVTKIGPDAQNMIDEANMFILFGDGAPDDLADYCFTHNCRKVAGDIHPGGYLVIDDEEYLITAVGSVVSKNLSTLGHITVALDGSTEVTLPGTLHIQVTVPPVIQQGSVIQIYE
ncbi:PTS glucitol/sorbitol transporter subunit IIA [Streptococcus sp. DD13]|uniref:PTS glucitol/sorbitol transporter subunit IIA n=1 Tax=Streptococcus sp. DD13 TaxID=1777881 RepID=UPI0007977475|nr:PTS glucitol/sorbitol transporter subunit IIA [Streptococcus sp. DD13]KXT77474.1 PTS system, glucitol/sorbitol-specific IIA component [Streptococcus sp. DD13]